MEWDDLGADRVISDQCRSHDCRDQLDKLHILNPNFKATLFAIPMEMTLELFNWCKINESWIELCWHGFYHSSNYECENLSYEQFDFLMRVTRDMLPAVKVQFKNIFRAPGWKISDGIYRWLKDNDWVVCDQDFNMTRWPKEMRNYLHDFEAEKQGEQKFYIIKDGKRHYIDAWHGHTWSVGWNGIEETFDQVKELVAGAKGFKFVSEAVDEIFHS